MNIERPRINFDSTEVNNRVRWTLVPHMFELGPTQPIETCKTVFDKNADTISDSDLNATAEQHHEPLKTWFAAHTATGHPIESCDQRPVGAAFHQLFSFWRLPSDQGHDWRQWSRLQTQIKQGGSLVSSEVPVTSHKELRSSPRGHVWDWHDVLIRRMMHVICRIGIWRKQPSIQNVLYSYVFDWRWNGINFTATV